MGTFTIGKLAEAAGVHVETIRYYERRGLLPAPPRTPSGYRAYSGDDLWRLQFIGRGKALGFTLTEIADILGTDRSTCDVLASARAKLGAVEDQQRQLAEVHARLRSLVHLCETGNTPDCLALKI